MMFYDNDESHHSDNNACGMASASRFFHTKTGQNQIKSYDMQRTHTDWS